jgi:hypothetical protein
MLPKGIKKYIYIYGMEVKAHNNLIGHILVDTVETRHQLVHYISEPSFAFQIVGMKMRIKMLVQRKGDSSRSHSY